MSLEWLDSDAFYSTLTEEEKSSFRLLINSGKTGPGTVPNKNWMEEKYFGEIRHCPACNMTRVTTCSACGCGSCKTCQYRWSCIYPTPTQPKINMESVYEDALAHFTANFGEFSTTVSYNDMVKAFTEAVDKVIKWRFESLRTFPIKIDDGPWKKIEVYEEIK